jgi:Tfp pilus assembly protein FimT
MTTTIKHHAKSERGFTLLDTIVTLSVMAIVGSMATMQVGTVRKSMQSDSAMRFVIGQFTTARELAITQRRNMEVRPVGDNSIQIIRNEVPTGTTVIASTPFEGSARYAPPSGLVDTPDGFGNGAAISFGVAERILFGPDGALIDQNGRPINGTIFLAIPGSQGSFRAVTVLGATGRVRGYRWTGTTWTRS